LGFGSTGPPDLSVMHVGTAAQAVRKSLVEPAKQLSVMHVGTAAQAVRKSLVEPAKQADGLSRRRY
jgi:hypothetical protein